MEKFQQKWYEFLLVIILIILDFFIIFLEPVPEAVYSFNNLIIFSEVLLIIWVSRWIRPDTFFYNRIFQLWVVPFIVISFLVLFLIDLDAELVHVYQSLFDALENGINPYTEPVIFHRLVDGSEIFSYFNYPPGEIPLYFTFYLIFNIWNYGILILANLFLNFIVIIIFFIKTRELGRKTQLLIIPLLLLINLEFSVSTIYLLIILAGFLILNSENPLTYKNRFFLIVIFFLGLTAKFFMIPFVILYFWDKLIEKREISYIIDLLIISTLVVIVFIPFNLISLIKHTFLFNLNLDVRGEVTTYYFNFLSGFFFIFDLVILYPLFVIFFLFLIIIATKKMHLLKRITIVSAFCLLIFPTPEYQYIGSIFGLLILSKLVELRDQKREGINPIVQ
ncbi:MAG: hypothetical protein HeimC3_09450 [Candidatus Heimdallarchaeota archaeon LC_3]|nr:MAG: hypothetical protein HeimC3_09450 [Candidatus Heimdallarchaeota archaeon LC_3]